MGTEMRIGWNKISRAAGGNTDKIDGGNYTGIGC